MRLGLSVTMLLVISQRGSAQLPVEGLRLVPGIGVDTTVKPTSQIVSLLRHYLTAVSDSERSSLWSRSERERWPRYDLLAPAIYNGNAHFAVLEVSPAVGMRGTFSLRILISAGDSANAPLAPLILYQVYAVLEEGRWVMANALPRLTRAWPIAAIGPIRFSYPPGHTFVRARAASSARFVDSLAKAFGLPRPSPIDYYFTDDLGTSLRALGLELYPFAPDTIDGRSNAFNRQVFVGLPTRGETYRHELAHVVLQPLLGPQTAGIVEEGLMTWVGGRAAARFSDLMPALAAYVTAHPTITLDTLVRQPPQRKGGVDPGYDGLAVLFKMV